LLTTTDIYVPVKNSGKYTEFVAQFIPTHVWVYHRGIANVPVGGLVGGLQHLACQQIDGIFLAFWFLFLASWSSML